MTGSSESRPQLLYLSRLQDCLAGHSYVATKVRTWREKEFFMYIYLPIRPHWFG